MFRGINSISLDAKGRITIPSRYRPKLELTGNQLIVTIDTEDPCLMLYPLPDWELLESKIEKLPSFEPAVRRMQRLFIGHATELEIDRNGRILLPAELREFAGIETQITLVGQGKKFEIWNKLTWEQCRQNWIAKSGEEKNLPSELAALAI